MKTMLYVVLLFLLIFIFTSPLLAQAPEWPWVYSAGGSSFDASKAVAVDSNGNSYYTGSFNGSISIGSFTLTSAGGSDMFVAKMDAAGNWLWAIRGGGSVSNGIGSYEADTGEDIAVDQDGNCYIVGVFRQTAILGPFNLSTQAWMRGMYVAKIDTNGNWLWAKQSSSSSNQAWGSGLALDSSNNVYVVGFYSGSCSLGGTTLTNSGVYDTFIAKLNSNGSWLWAQKAGGSDVVRASKVAVDSASNAYVAGYYSNCTASFGSHSLTNSGDNDAYIAKINVSGTWQWARKGGGAGSDLAQDIAVDSYSNVYVAGLIGGSATFGSTALTPLGSTDLFVSKLDTAGSWIWTKQSTSCSYSRANSIFVDNSDQAYVMGTYSNDPITLGNTTLSLSDNYTFLASIDEMGQWLWAVNALGQNACKDGLGDYYLCGSFSNSITVGTTTLTSNGNNDIIVGKMSAQRPPNPATLVSPQNGAVNVAINEALSWLAPLEGTMPTAYKLYFGTNNPPSNIAYGTNLGNVLSYTHPVNLNVNTTYYWKIVPTNANGMAPNCPIWSFTTPTNPIPYQELFNSSTFPSGWTQTYDGTIPSDRWSVSNTSYSGGTAYEMEALWCEGEGISRFISPAIYIGDMSDITVQFKQYFGDYAPGVTAKLQYSYDLNTWFDSSFIYPSGQGDLTIDGRADMFNLESDLIHIAWVLDGDHYQFEYWFIDNVEISEYVPPETVALPHYQSFDPGADISDWLLTISGSLAESPWGLWDTNYAGGQPNELGASWVQGWGTSRLISPALDTQGVSAFTVSFDQYYQDYGAGIRATLQYSHDMLSWHDTHWSIEGSRWNHTDGVSVLIDDINAPVTYVAWTLLDNHAQFDHWFIDNIAIELPKSHDVAPVSIDVKPIISISQYLPQGKVINMGTNPEVFDVTLTIGSFYSSTVQTSANPGEIVELSFAPLYAEADWTFPIVMTTALITDQNQNNNSMRSNVSILPLNKSVYADVAYDWGQGFRGPARFSLDNPEQIISLPGPVAYTTFISGADWIGNGWYGAEYYTDAGTDRWWKIDHTAGTMTHLGNHGTLDLTGIAYDDSRDITYACTATHLYTINRNTGVTTMVGPFNDDNVYMIAIAYHPTDDLIVGVDVHYDGIWLIDRLTGNATWNGYLGININYAQDLAFDRDTGYLYLAGYPVGQDAGGALYWINFQRGAIKIGNFQSRFEISGFAIPHGTPEPPVLTIDDTGTLSWYPVPGAEDYKIYASDSPDNGFSLIATTALTSWSDPAYPQTKRFYRVCANSGNTRVNGIVQDSDKPEAKIPANRKRSIPQVMNTDTPQTDRARF